MSTPVATLNTSPATCVQRRGDERLDRGRGVVDVEPVAARVTVPVDRQRLAHERLRDESRHDLLRMLPRPVVVERAHDHDRQVVRDPVAVGEAVPACLRGRVGAARVERVLLVHRVPLRGAVHLARRDQQEPLDGRPADRVEQDLRPLDVRGHELGGTLENRLLDMRLGGRVDDHVDAADDLPHELGVADVAVDELQARMAHHLGEVLEVARVGERVERDHVVIRVLQQVADEVRRDEPGAAGDEDTLAHSSRSTRYRGRCSTTRWILPRCSPTRARMKPWTPSTATTRAPSRSGPGKSAFEIQ